MNCPHGIPTNEPCGVCDRNRLGDTPVPPTLIEIDKRDLDRLFRIESDCRELVGALENKLKAQQPSDHTNWVLFQILQKTKRTLES